MGISVFEVMNIRSIDIKTLFTFKSVSRSWHRILLVIWKGSTWGLKKWKVCLPFGLKIGRVGRFFFFFFFNLDTEEMQYHSCVYILGHAEPQNWYNTGVRGGGCVPLNLVKVPFGDSYYIFWHFEHFVWKYKIENQKKKTNKQTKKKT